MQNISQGTHHVSHQVAQSSRDTRQVLDIVRQIHKAVAPDAESPAATDDAVMAPLEMQATTDDAVVAPLEAKAKEAEAMAEEDEKDNSSSISDSDSEASDDGMDVGPVGSADAARASTDADPMEVCQSETEKCSGCGEIGYDCIIC